MNILEYENTQELKTHGNPDFPFNIYLCSIPLDFTAVPAHWHNDMEIIYIKTGTGIISVDLEGYPVQKGDIILIAPWQHHAIDQYQNTSMEYENIIFQLNMLISSGNDLCSDQFFTPLLHNRLHLPVHLSEKDSCYPKVIHCLDKIDRLSGYGDTLSMLGIKGSLFELFHILFCHCPNTFIPVPHDKSLDTVKLILKHVETHYHENLSIQAMADLCGFSCSHFMKFFKQHLGVSFTAYLNDYRLTMAARMLTASSDTVVAVSEAAGFENLSYFNRMFKRKYRVTPSQYRKG